MLYWLFEDHHNGYVNAEYPLFFAALATAVFEGFFLWLPYVALEPFVRRRWPRRIVSWSRLLRGDYRDPLVGRDILIGAAAGGVIVLSSDLTPVLLRAIGKPFEMFSNPGSTFVGSHFWSRFTLQLTAALFLSSIVLFLLLLFVVILRRERLALVVLWIVLTVFAMLVAQSNLTGLPIAMLGSTCTLFILYRFGLLALCATTFFAHLWVFLSDDHRLWCLVCVRFPAWSNPLFSIGGLRFLHEFGWSISVWRKVIRRLNNNRKPAKQTAEKHTRGWSVVRSMDSQRVDNLIPSSVILFFNS